MMHCYAGWQLQIFMKMGPLIQHTNSLGGVGHCYAWHVRVTFCIGNVCSLSYFQFGAIGGLYMLYHTNKQKLNEGLI